MNYLAHLSLAKANAASRTGNLMGDFLKGVALEALPPMIVAGIENHRLVDRVTDQHAAVLALKPLFSARYRRFAGVMLDVSFDFFLTQHWARFHAEPRVDFIRDCYQHLLSQHEFMPSSMQWVVGRMAAQDWLGAYADWQSIGEVLDRIAARIRFANQFDGALDELSLHRERIEAAFLLLYPTLLEEVRTAGLEREGRR